MRIDAYRIGNRIAFEYINHRGEVNLRRIMVLGLDYGSNEWYPNDQWFIRGFDLDTEADRSFALDRIVGADIRRF